MAGHAGRWQGSEAAGPNQKRKTPIIFLVWRRDKITGALENRIERLLYAGSIDLCPEKDNPFCAYSSRAI